MRAAAYFGFMAKARHKVFRMNSKLLSVSSGVLSTFMLKISTPSLAYPIYNGDCG
jgi:hypothetical protein